ncbi:MAG: ytrB [Phycisphaerales bacterium]|nr:ytrB [Phycisphaerales bacterium]
MVAPNTLLERAEPEPIAGDSVVEVRNVCRRFGAKLALDDVSLSLPAGTVLGLVGENGAGKTTLIKHILGLLKAQAGTVRVFGLDPVAQPVRVLSQIGYLSEEPDLPGWMRVRDLLRYVAAFYPSWDHAYAEQLRQEFALDPMAKVKHLSKGQKARAGLLAALAYRPQLLVLDEPSSGLDPIVRRDILGAIIRTIADEGRTVLFSSHLLAEVERVSDRVAMIRAGRILFCDSLDKVKQTHARLTFRFDSPRESPPALEGALTWDGAGHDWTAVYAGSPGDLPTQTQQWDARLVEQSGLSLDEIFLARTTSKTATANASEEDEA